MKFECPFCEYTSNRKYNLQSHMNRKHPIVDIENVHEKAENVNEKSENVTKKAENVNEKSENVTEILANVNEEKEIVNENNEPRYSCAVCHKVFSTRQGKYQHMKKKYKCKPPAATVCQPVEPVVTPTQQYPVTKHTAVGGCICSYCKKEFSRVDNLTRHLMGCRVKRLSDAGDISVANAPANNTTINNTTNTNCHNTNITNNITINYRSFDKPCIDHIDSDIVKSLYLDNNRNLKRMIKAGVNRIWQTPENNTFELPFKDKPKGLPNSEIMKVHCDGEDQYFPAHHVVDVLLHRCATVCESFLRQHYYDESIPGTGVLKHANVLEELAIEFQETWDEDSTFRNEYKPFVRSAILECLQRRKEREEANSNVD